MKRGWAKVEIDPTLATIRKAAKDAEKYAFAPDKERIDARLEIRAALHSARRLTEKLELALREEGGTV